MEEGRAERRRRTEGGGQAPGSARVCAGVWRWGPGAWGSSFPDEETGPERGRKASRLEPSAPDTQTLLNRSKRCKSRFDPNIR